MNLLIIGSPSFGYDFFGPFLSSEEALAFAPKALKLSGKGDEYDYWSVPLIDPDFPNDDGDREEDKAQS